MSFATTGKIAAFARGPHIPWFLVKRLKVLKSEFKHWSYVLILSVPGRLGEVARRNLLPFGAVGKDVKLDRGSWIEHPERISIGDNTGANRYCFIHGGGGIEIGQNVMIGPFVTIHSQNHNWRDRGLCIKDQGLTRAKVVIEDDVWLCVGSIVLPGVRIREGTVVAAGAVVTRDTEAYSIVGGIPAVKIGQRTDKREPSTNTLVGGALRIMCVGFVASMGQALAAL